MDKESRLQDLLVQDISIANPDWMVVGREVPTEHGGRIDILALDSSANLIVLELKRDETPREVVAQALDYGSWVQRLTLEQIRQIHQRHLGAPVPTLSDAFVENFDSELPEECTDHKLVIVAASLDAATERIVDYLSYHGIDINVLFFQMFEDDNRQYLARTWVRDPDEEPSGAIRRTVGLWQGQYYVLFEDDNCRNWKHAKLYGFISAGGGDRYTRRLRELRANDRVWVHLLGTGRPRRGGGYVGTGRVVAEAVPAYEFKVEHDGEERLLMDIIGDSFDEAPDMFDPGFEEYIVKVEWIHCMEREDAVWERGFFSNRNVVARPRVESWNSTLKRLGERWGITD